MIGMSDEKQKPVRYCNSCKHVQKPMTEFPCSDCVPANLGGPDRWEAKHKHNELNH